MARKKRLIAGLAVAMLCIPGTCIRSDVSLAPTDQISINRVQGESKGAINGWSRVGVWEANADTLLFGGFSALLALGPSQLIAFSDRGARFELTVPGKASMTRKVDLQPVEPERFNELWDIESATRDPATGEYWLGYENTHAIRRFSRSSQKGPVRILDDEVDWTINKGAEAMVRLADGRFMIVPEGSDEGLIFSDDPAEGGNFKAFPFENPDPNYAVTDMTQLPDGRLLLLMRKVASGFPPFASLLAIGDPPMAGQRGPWKPEIALDLTKMVPRENYEGIAAIADDDGGLSIWLLSDDNFAAFQRTLLVKLRFDPEAGQEASDDQNPKN
ncbi:MAG: esterase-like activity of phytase family protein [Pseudomonadota bacterium]